MRGSGPRTQALRERGTLSLPTLARRADGRSSLGNERLWWQVGEPTDGARASPSSQPRPRSRDDRLRGSLRAVPPPSRLKGAVAGAPRRRRRASLPAAANPGTARPAAPTYNAASEGRLPRESPWTPTSLPSNHLSHQENFSSGYARNGRGIDRRSRCPCTGRAQTLRPAARSHAPASSNRTDWSTRVPSHEKRRFVSYLCFPGVVSVNRGSKHRRGRGSSTKKI
jgi:hypothetical protein